MVAMGGVALYCGGPPAHTRIQFCFNPIFFTFFSGPFDAKAPSPGGHSQQPGGQWSPPFPCKSKLQQQLRHSESQEKWSGEVEEMNGTNSHSTAQVKGKNWVSPKIDSDAETYRKIHLSQHRSSSELCLKLLVKQSCWRIPTYQKPMLKG